MENRSVVARGWLKLQRDLSSEAGAERRRNGTFGSAYGSGWVTAPTPTSTPPDHVVPRNWFNVGTRLLIEAADPGEIAAATYISTLSQNSAKGDRAVGLFLPGEGSSASQGVYVPRGVSEPKKRMLAKQVCWMFGILPLISDSQRRVGIGTFARSVGSQYYARAWRFGQLRPLATAPASAYERRIQLLCLAMPKWQFANPFTFRPSLLDDDVAGLLQKRFLGDDSIPALVDEALQQSIQSAPR